MGSNLIHTDHNKESVTAVHNQCQLISGKAPWTHVGLIHKCWLNWRTGNMLCGWSFFTTDGHKLLSLQLYQKHKWKSSLWLWVLSLLYSCTCWGKQVQKRNQNTSVVHAAPCSSASISDTSHLPQLPHGVRYPCRLHLWASFLSPKHASDRSSGKRSRVDLLLGALAAATVGSLWKGRSLGWIGVLFNVGAIWLFLFFTPVLVWVWTTVTISRQQWSMFWL